MMLLLPLDFETAKAFELRGAVEEAGRTGDMSRVNALVNEMAATSKHLTRDDLLAAVLYKLALDAFAQKNTGTHSTFIQMLLVYCSDTAVDNVFLAAEVGDAARQGWLTPKAYDALAVKLAVLPVSHVARQLFARVERRDATSNDD